MTKLLMLHIIFILDIVGYNCWLLVKSFHYQDFSMFKHLCVIFSAFLISCSSHSPVDDARSNVLFISIDDLNHWGNHLRLPI
jgi:hypothetical protein